MHTSFDAPQRHAPGPVGPVTLTAAAEILQLRGASEEVVDGPYNGTICLETRQEIDVSEIMHVNHVWRVVGNQGTQSPRRRLVDRRSIKAVHNLNRVALIEVHARSDYVHLMPSGPQRFN